MTVDKFIAIAVVLIALVLTIVIIVKMVQTHKAKTKVVVADDSRIDSTNQETFVTSGGNQVYVDDATKAIKGGPIYTNSLTNMSEEQLYEQASKGFVHDGQVIGVGIADGFDAPYNSQLEIERIRSRLQPGDAQTNTEMAQISRNINASADNATHAFFTRAGAGPTKLVVNTNEIRCVIPDKYIPERDKSRQVAVVGGIIPVQGYDVRVERLDEDLVADGTSFAQYSNNSKRRRSPTAGGTPSSNNLAVLNQTVGINSDGKVVIADAGGNKSPVVLGAANGGGEKQTNVYIKDGNSIDGVLGSAKKDTLSAGDAVNETFRTTLRA